MNVLQSTRPFTSTTRCLARGRTSVKVQASAAGAKRVLITGGNTGIGYETAKELCRQGHEVVIACRNMDKAEAAAQKIRSGNAAATISTVNLDLGDLASVQACATRLLDSAPFDVVLNNAGVMATPQMTTKDGFEFQLGTNHLGHFALTTRLLPSLIKADKPVRIINVASAAHQAGSVRFDDLMRQRPGAYQPWEAYGQSKLANIMFTYELAARLASHPQITVNCLHPGVVRTELGRYMVDEKNMWYMGPAIALAQVFFKTPEQGAQTSIYLASSPEAVNVSSKYFVDCKPVSSSPASYDKATAQKLFEVSAELTKCDALAPVRA
eukprot:CAMPEP_0202857962 /NCGR_PEP_ID=MMETSP1391-20130828/693_1 /ASSEMBLY_ACC=CAM_ASM_000867 /TAXON_ID=1034604 /ORGANISM="Chlamydomonas leiostraca, Strain SAG 11-49" /LENGTH=324 /DNA_ID=CAMNT_0049536827 /DNA_START=22 /DNA_END=996 /DNA_ORIENTATION=+